jgi:hypothetical protein
MAPYIPKNDVEKLLLKTIMEEVIFSKEFGVLDFDVVDGKYKAYFTPLSGTLDDDDLVLGSDWDEQGHYHVVIDISLKEFNISTILDGDVIKAQLWFDVDTKGEKVEIWWRIPESPWGDAQESRWPDTPVLFAPRTVV